MIVEINTKHLFESELTPNQFFVCQVIYERAYNTYESLRLYYPKILEEILPVLIDKGYIKKDSSRIKYSVTNSYLKFVVEADEFDQLLSKFPVYVIRNTGNKDYLRTDKTRCKRKYSRIIKTKKSSHDYIMECLDYEIKVRTAENSMNFMKKLPNWLDSREWETWGERMENEIDIKEEDTYGTELE